jgi:hypothetical protein
MAENTPQRNDPHEALKKIPLNPAQKIVDKIGEKIEQGADPKTVREQMADKTNKVIADAVTAAGEGIQGELDEWLTAANNVFGSENDNSSNANS